MVRHFLAALCSVAVLASVTAVPASALEDPPQPVANCVLTYQDPDLPTRVPVRADCERLASLDPLVAYPTLEAIYSGYSATNQAIDSIADFAALKQFPNLKNAAFGNVNDVALAHFGALSGLRTLQISGTFSDLTPLENLHFVNNLGLASNNVTSLAPLAEMSELDTVTMNVGGVADLSPLGSAQKLRSLIVIAKEQGKNDSSIQRVQRPFAASAVKGVAGEVVDVDLSASPGISAASTGLFKAGSLSSNKLVWTVSGQVPATMPQLINYQYRFERKLELLPDVPGLAWQNTYGIDRFATSVEVSKLGFAHQVPVVYLASGMNFPDALVAGPAAAVEGGPLLLTSSSVLPNVVRNEIVRLRPGKVVVVGGPASVQPAVFNAVKSLVPNTVRRDGIDRYAVARAVALATPWKSTTSYVASGQTFPDALSAAAPAGAAKAPLILVPGSANTVNSETISMMNNLGVRKTIVAGGTGAVSSGAFTALARFSPVRVGGENRYVVNRSLNAELTKTADRVYFASGETFSDALAGSAVAGAQGRPLYLARSNCISSGILADIAASNTVVMARGFGGYAAVDLRPVNGKVATCG